MHINGDFDQTRFPVRAISPTTLPELVGPTLVMTRPRLVNTSDV